MTLCLCGAAHRPGLGRRALLASAVMLAALPARAQAPAPAPAPASAGAPGPALLEDLVAANRILFDQGVVDGFGHVSARHDKDPNRYLLARSMAPALVGPEDIMEFDLDSFAVDARGRAVYLERFIHGAIYQARPDVGAIVHSHSPAVIPFADTKVVMRPMNHIAGFLGAGVAMFEIRDTAGGSTDMLIRDAGLGHALARTLGSRDIALMRGHGSVAVARDIRRAVFRAVYTEVNARSQGEALRLAGTYAGTPEYLNDAEAKAAASTNDGLVDRPWELWKRRAMAK